MGLISGSGVEEKEIERGIAHGIDGGASVSAKRRFVGTNLGIRRIQVMKM